MTSSALMRASKCTVLTISSSIRSLRGLGCTSHGRGQTGVVPTGNALRRSGFKLPETIFEDMIAGMAFVIICLGVSFIVAMLT